MKSTRTETLFGLAALGVLVLFLLAGYMFAPERVRPSRFLRPTFVEGNSPLRFDAPIAARRIFVDRPHVEVATSTNRAGYLSGGEFVGRPVQATDPDDADLSYFVGLEDPDDDFWFFDVSPSGQLHVSPAGGNDRLGLTDDRVYRLVVTAADQKGGWDAVTVGVYLDSASAAPLGDGVCPN